MSKTILLHVVVKNPGFLESHKVVEGSPLQGLLLGTEAAAMTLSRVDLRFNLELYF